MTINFKPLASRANKENLCSLQLWVNVNGQRATTTLPLKVNAGTFEKDITSKKSNMLQSYCLSIRQKIDNYWIAHQHCTSADIIAFVKNDFKEKTYDLITLSKEYLAILSKRENVGEITFSTYNKYRLTFKKLIEHLGNKAVSDITAADILSFQLELSKKVEHNVVVAYICRTKAIFEFAIDSEHLEKNPVRIKLRKETKEVTALTLEELEKLENVKISNSSLDRIRDLFLICCYTGLSYADLMNLRKSDIKEQNGVKFIEKSRQKTGVKFFIPIVDKVNAILDRYPEIPHISNQKLNLSLKVLAIAAGVDTNLHMHLARHTALTNFLNVYHLPLEVVSKIAGHSNITMTQHYSKISNNRLLEEMQKIV